jgi:hypothetical protein
MYFIIQADMYFSVWVLRAAYTIWPQGGGNTVLYSSSEINT